MNLRFVEAFYWVVTLKSVTRAADKLFLTQSAMSSRIAALETELGVLLLDRRDRRFRLTVAGTRFYAHAQRLLELQRNIKAELGSSASLAVSMRIGAIESVLHSWLMPWIGRLRADHPSLELELTVETTPVLLDQIRRGALDVALTALPAGTEGIRSLALAPMEMVFVGNARQHKRRIYTIEELAELELLTFQRGSQPHVALTEIFHAAQLQARRIHTISSISAIVQLVLGGFGVATLPRSAIERFVSAPELKVLKTKLVLPPLPIHLNYRIDPASPLLETVAESFRLQFSPAKMRPA
ncbi:HTH-type transcriptional regulator BenM [Burkholderiales bacterium]|nr:MAG: LysR family transcriptional regulator [Burkholderiales bacterium]CAG1012561.1 HTH-type transcriptional regulator BenM [Burkholderiales bacterium]